MAARFFRDECIALVLFDESLNLYLETIQNNKDVFSRQFLFANLSKLFYFASFLYLDMTVLINEIRKTFTALTKF